VTSCSKELGPLPMPKRPLQLTTRTPKTPDFKFELLPLHSPSLGQSLLVSFPPLIDTLKFSGYPYLIRGPAALQDRGEPQLTARYSLRHFLPSNHQPALLALPPLTPDSSQHFLQTEPDSSLHTPVHDIHPAAANMTYRHKHGEQRPGPQGRLQHVRV
jgi:hypothetical protein